MSQQVHRPQLTRTGRWADADHWLQDGWGPNNTIELRERNDKRKKPSPDVGGRKQERRTDGELEGARREGGVGRLWPWREKTPGTSREPRPGSRH